MSDKRMVEPSPEFDDWAALSRKFGHLSIAECYAGLEERDQLRAALAEARQECAKYRTSHDAYQHELSLAREDSRLKESHLTALRERNARLVEGLKKARAECADYMETYPGCAALMEDVIFTLDKLLASGSGEGQ